MCWRGSYGVALLGVAALSSMVVTVGCAASRPAAEVEATETGEQVSSIFYVDEPAPTTHQVCAPLESRACSESHVDSYGTKHCTKSVQFCRSDGYGWHACGDLDAATSELPDGSAVADTDAGSTDEDAGSAPDLK